MTLTERRQIENEMIFRRANEKVGDAINKLDNINIDEGNPQLASDKDLKLHFKCECSDEMCEKRILIKLTDYQEIHKNRDAFIIKLTHQVLDIETVIKTYDNFCVVQKNNSVEEPGKLLNKTSIINKKV